MTGKPRARKTSKPRVVPEDLQQVVLQTLQGASALKLGDLKKSLPVPYQPFAKEAQAIARELAERGSVPYFRPTKTQLVFFPEDPSARIEAVLRSHLKEPATEKELTELVADHAPGFQVVVKPWLASAVKQRRIHEHAALKGSRAKRYYIEPDLRAALKSVLTALQKALAKTDALGISREQVAKVLLDELGSSTWPTSASTAKAATNGESLDRSSRSSFVAELGALASENPQQAMLSVTELRRRLLLDKREFDAIALDLAREGAISLHHHDNAASMPEHERMQLIQDAHGRDYVGISLTRGA